VSPQRHYTHKCSCFFCFPKAPLVSLILCKIWLFELRLSSQRLGAEKSDTEAFVTLSIIRLEVI
jgi:hypothetical protein